MDYYKFCIFYIFFKYEIKASGEKVYVSLNRSQIYIENFYDHISENKFLEKFFKVNYGDIEDISDENNENSKKIDDSSLFELIINSLQSNISEILVKKNNRTFK